MRETEKKNPPPPACRGVAVARTLICVGAFYGAMVWFNGVSMQESASLLEFGWQRSALCAVNRPLEVLSRYTGAYLLRQGLRDTVGRWLNTSE